MSKAKVKLNMETTHIDVDGKKVSRPLLQNGVKIDIAKKSRKVDKQFSPLLRQLIGCCSPLLSMVALGNVIGYSSILLTQLKRDVKLHEMDASDGSWIASSATASMSIACLLSAVAIGRYGRKSIFQIMNVPLVIGWMILYFSENIYGLLLGRVVTGFCVGLLTTPVPVYISEITQSTYRGLFLAAQGFAIAFGILMPHAIGTYLKWDIVAIVCASIPILCYIVIAMVPESPSWLLDDGQVEKAIASFKWFRGHYIDSMYEFEKLVEGQKISKLQIDSMAIHNILLMIRSKSFYKPLLILLLYSITLHAAGPNVIAFYTVTILENSLGGNIDERVATIILDVVRVIASIVSCIVVTGVGRRSLTIFSGMTTAASLFGLSAYLFFAAAYEQVANLYGIPLTLYALYMVFVTIGLNPLVWTLTGELFPLRYRGIGSALVTFFNFVLLFASVKTTPSLFRTLDEQGVFLAFGICCFVGTILLAVFLPETRNKTLQEIEDSYYSARGTSAEPRGVKVRQQQQM